MSKLEKVFGIHAVDNLLRKHPDAVSQLFVQKNRQDKRLNAIIELAKNQGISVQPVDKHKMYNWIDGRHQGVIADAKLEHKQYSEDDLSSLVKANDGQVLFLVLDGVTDPHNLGACLRTADAAGVQALIVPKDNSAALNSTAIKVACGAAETVPLVRATNLARCLKRLQEQGVWIIGTAGEAQQTIYQTRLTGNLALVMGAEDKGMRRLTREHCDELVNIPMQGDVSSLNVSVATGVCLFEIVRQRQS